MPDPEKIYDVETEGDGPTVEYEYDDEGNVIGKRVGLGIAGEFDEGLKAGGADDE